MNETNTNLISPWQPETDPRKLKLLGKLLEELGELSSATSRCLIQGIDAVHPVTKKPNHEWLMEEIADVHACISMLTHITDVRYDFIHERMVRKVKGFTLWLKDM